MPVDAFRCETTIFMLPHAPPDAVALEVTIRDGFSTCAADASSPQSQGALIALGSLLDPRSALHAWVCGCIAELAALGARRRGADIPQGVLGTGVRAWPARTVPGSVPPVDGASWVVRAWPRGDRVFVLTTGSGHVALVAPADLETRMVDGLLDGYEASHGATTPLLRSLSGDYDHRLHAAMRRHRSHDTDVPSAWLHQAVYWIPGSRVHLSSDDAARLHEADGFTPRANYGATSCDAQHLTILDAFAVCGADGRVELHAHDVVAYCGRAAGHQPLEERLALLRGVCGAWESSSMTLVPVRAAPLEADDGALHGADMLVASRSDSPYVVEWEHCSVDDPHRLIELVS